MLWKIDLVFDISNGGVFVLTTTLSVLPVGSKLDMIMLEAKQDDILFKMEIARTDKQGLGLKFLGFERDGEIFALDMLK